MADFADFLTHWNLVAVPEPFPHLQSPFPVKGRLSKLTEQPAKASGV